MLEKIFCLLKKNNKNREILFDGDDDVFKREILKCKIYAEYGCGKSTSWVINNSLAKVITVDTDKNWVAKIELEVKQNKRLNSKWVDLGDVGDWGRPKSYDKHENIERYTNWIWEQHEVPDLVLIDGRFRVCCFLTVIKNSKPGTKIIFDDYSNRRYYHFVEKFLKPDEFCGRQALFVIPDNFKINLGEIEQAINKFRFVMD